MSSNFGQDKSNQPNNDFGGAISGIPDLGKIDLGKLSPAYGIPAKGKKNTGPEYIPYDSRGRDIYGRVTFNTGVLWLGGFIGGASYGFVDGWKSATSPSYKLRFNSVMNAVSKHGSKIGNGLGVIGKFHISRYMKLFVIGFMHTASVGIADQLQIEKVTGTSISTPIFAGVLTGGLYKSTRGPRAAALAAVIGGTVSTVYWYGGTYFYSIILGRNGKF